MLFILVRLFALQLSLIVMISLRSLTSIDALQSFLQRTQALHRILLCDCGGGEGRFGLNVWADSGDKIDIIDCLVAFDHYYYAALFKQLKLILTLIYLLTI